MAFLLYLGMEGQLGQYYFHEYDTVGTAAAVSLTLQGLKGQRYKRSLPQQEHMTQHTCFACLFVPLSVHLCVFPSIFLSLSLSAHLPSHPSVHLSNSERVEGTDTRDHYHSRNLRLSTPVLLVYLFLCLCVHLCVCLSVFFSLSLCPLAIASHSLPVQL